MTRPETRRSTDSRPSWPWYAERAGLFGKNFLEEYADWMLPEQTARQVRFVREWASKRGSLVLDAGCGNGRHLNGLAERGFVPVGLDLNAAMLDPADRGRVVLADMRRIPFLRVFDTAISLFSSFGYFSDEENRQTLVEIARALRPGGRLILDVMSADFIRERFTGDHERHEKLRSPDGVQDEHVRSFDATTSRFRHERRRRDVDGNERRWHSDIRLYSPAELEQLCSASGFRSVVVKGGYEGEDAGPERPRLVFVGEVAG